MQGDGCTACSGKVIEHLKGLPKQLEGQGNRRLVTGSGSPEDGHWFSPDAVRGHINEARAGCGRDVVALVAAIGERDGSGGAKEVLEEFAKLGEHFISGEGICATIERHNGNGIGSTGAGSQVDESSVGALQEIERIARGAIYGAGEQDAGKWRRVMALAQTILANSGHCVSASKLRCTTARSQG